LLGKRGQLSGKNISRPTTELLSMKDYILSKG